MCQTDIDNVLVRTRRKVLIKALRLYSSKSYYFLQMRAQTKSTNNELTIRNVRIIETKIKEINLLV